MNFKNWLNEYNAVGIKGLFKSTCGDKSCSRGSSNWLPEIGVDYGMAPNQVEVPLNFGENTKGYYDENNNRFSLFIKIAQELKGKKILMQQLVQKSRESIEIINQNKILSFINNKTNTAQQQLTSNNKFGQLKYLKNYISKDSLIIVYQLA